jgi:hypothetical protein
VTAQLILGSLELEEADMAIDAAEAAQLLPLWQAYQSLSSSDTTATAELDALVSQIQSTMQPGQVAAIAAMQLTADSVPEILEAQGGGQFRGNGTGNGAFPAPPEGGFPGGGPGGIPGGGPGGIPGLGPGEASPEARATAIAQRMAQGGDQGATFLTRGMLNQLIISLQLKTGELTEADLAAQQAQRAAMRWLPLVAETTGISLDTLQEAIDGGQALGEAITAGGGDLAAVEAALRDALKTNPGLDDQAIADQIDAVLSARAPSE